MRSKPESLILKTSFNTENTEKNTEDAKAYVKLISHPQGEPRFTSVAL